MLFIISRDQKKPDRLISDDQKNAQYHCNYARWCLGEGNNVLQKRRINEYILHKHFYSNRQWLLPEDTLVFLKDIDNQDRGRIKATYNYIMPTVNTYKGNAERLKFNFKVQSLSPLARKRRDLILAKLLAYQGAAKTLPQFGDYLRGEGFPVGLNETETEAAFEQLYTDQYVIGVNRFARAINNLSNPDKFKGQWALDLALGGVGVAKRYIHGMDWRYKRVPPESWGFDNSALEDDLSDANYFFEESLLTPTEIYERCPDLGDEERKEIEKYVSGGKGQSYSTGLSFETGGKMPVYFAVWRDTIYEEYGYVRDQFGQTVLQRIGHIPEGQEKPTYMKEDTLPVDQLTAYQKKVLHGKRTNMLYADLWRYAEFIPDEIISTKYKVGERKDIVLNWGVWPYQQPDLYRSTNMKPPYKVGIWSYLDGEILSPVSVMINPQRMINRFLSVMEQQINSSGLDGVTYDRDLLEGEEEEFIKNIKRGEPAGINARGGGIQNAIGQYKTSNIPASEYYFRLIEQFLSMMERQTGVNAALQGQSQSPDQLVGVMQLMIQRGSIIQEPFFKALSNIYQGIYQDIVSSGRRFYIDNDTDLIDFVGEESGEIIKLSKEVRNENMAVTIKRVMDEDQERQLVDQTIYTWMQFGLIDQPTASKLIGKANTEEALEALKEYQKNLAAQQRLAAQQAEFAEARQAQEDTQVGQQLQAEQARQEAREDSHKDADRIVKLAQKTAQKKAASPAVKK